MSSPSQPVVIIASLQVQSSFQAIPLGAACVAAALKADPYLGAAARIQLADYSLEDPQLAALSPERAGEALAARIASLIGPVSPEGPSAIVGFSVFVWNREAFESCARALRSRLPGVVLFAGGPEVTAAPDSFATTIPNGRYTDGSQPSSATIPNGRYTDGPQPSSITIPNGRYSEARPLFDFLLPGEGEASAVALVSSLLKRERAIEAEAVILRAPSVSLDTLPSPWLDGSLDATSGVRDHRGALWELARGCPYACAYCYESKGDKKVRPIPLERLRSELKRFVASGIERVFVLDPTYNANRERALALLALIAKEAPELHFNFEVRAELLDRELVAAFAKIPCSLQIGLQSSNAEALRLVNRPCDLKGFAKKIALLNDAGIVFGLDLMYGLPGDTLPAFRSSIDYAIAQYPNNLEIFRLAVLPGTALADQADALGLRHAARPPYLVESTPGFSAQDLDRAAALARACDVFYTQGRAVTWFNSVLHCLKLKASQFFQDFADYLAAPATRAQFPDLAPRDGAYCELPHERAEALQLAFLKKKFADKGKGFLLPALSDVIRLNGAWTRALAEGSETRLALSYHPEDVFSGDAMDLEYFTENACMEQCQVRVFSGPDGPDLEIS